MNLVRNSGSFLSEASCPGILSSRVLKGAVTLIEIGHHSCFLSLKNCLYELNALGFLLVSVFQSISIPPLEPPSRPSDHKAFVPVRAGDTEPYYLTNKSTL